ncbi:hypothetical protein HBHAL_4397 [Halobacillus halophilus DSM 2266]|uniref:Antigen I/II N-terminal domain-containing protein n=1 Tax=Halobacillus halophilus (strain ATCC 35676 / DSM 2266 / JCM 20832 / KCTC 3685 / LMG 17431 / NBRC 102448 / NCIMB 2269) TaxID=866895 RepID=I0JRG6_HALH3|nr:hypothetical protein [Halobacillus halophilus]CCG46737.1 hypothetical protein HBHAL_4397 [Halobacillus halophilus DSM 2266]
MKKLWWILAACLFMLAACSSDSSSSSSSEAEGGETYQSEELAASEQEGSSSEEKEASVEMDKNVLGVKVTVPKSFFELQNQNFERIKADAEAKGIPEVVDNGESVTYRMSESKHKELMKEMEKQMTAAIEEIKNEDNYSSIQDIQATASYSEFMLSVDREEYENSLDGFAVMGLGVTGMLYQLFNGAGPEEYDVTVNVVDAEKEEVFDTITYPEAFESLKEVEVE